MNCLIVTGLSGAGKSQAIKYIEDLGYFCVDNMLPDLIPSFISLCHETKKEINRSRSWWMPAAAIRLTVCWRRFQIPSF